MEEEHKLFYVACSRAKLNLYLTASEYSQTYSGYFDKSSRFINEVDNQKYQKRIPCIAKENKEAKETVLLFKYEISNLCTHTTLFKKLISKIFNFLKCKVSVCDGLNNYELLSIEKEKL